MAFEKPSTVRMNADRSRVEPQESAMRILDCYTYTLNGMHDEVTTRERGVETSQNVRKVIHVFACFRYYIDYVNICGKCTWLYISRAYTHTRTQKYHTRIHMDLFLHLEL